MRSILFQILVRCRLSDQPLAGHPLGFVMRSKPAGAGFKAAFRAALRPGSPVSTGQARVLRQG